MDFLEIAKLLATDYFSVPDYQRDYEWTNVQNSVLIEDIIETAKNDSNHFLGAIVTIPFEPETGKYKSIDFSDYKIKDKNVKHIVDGQQRLTSFSILIKALLD